MISVSMLFVKSQKNIDNLDKYITNVILFLFKIIHLCDGNVKMYFPKKVQKIYLIQKIDLTKMTIMKYPISYSVKM